MTFMPVSSNETNNADEVFKHNRSVLRCNCRLRLPSLLLLLLGLGLLLLALLLLELPLMLAVVVPYPICFGERARVDFLLF